MVGFIRNIFKSRKSEEVVEQPREAREKTPKKAQAYFLDEDNARTFGNIDYMRTAKKVRRTFPKTAGSPEEMEIIVEVASIKGNDRSKQQAAGTSTNAQTTAVETDEATARRRADKSMDVFRNMARDIKK